MSEGTFTHRIDLIVILRDTVTGNRISDYGAVFLKNERPFRIRATDTGWLGVNIGREDFILGVNVRGFEKIQFPVRYDSLDTRMPTVEINMIPEQTLWSKPPMLTLRGSMAGMEELQAVSLEETELYLASDDEKRHQLTLYNPRKKILRYSSYAVVDKERQEFEIVTVLKTLSDGMVQLNHGLKKKFKGNNLFTRPVYGMVSDGGEYLLRVPESTDSVWLVRFVVEGREYFQMVDFQNPKLSLGEEKSKTSKRG